MDRQNSDDIIKFLDGMASSDDVLFGFLDEGNQSPEFSSRGDYGDEEDDGEDNACCSSEEKKAFWDEQEQLVQANLYRTSSIETKIKKATREALKEVNRVGLQCVCQSPARAGDCRDCLRREIYHRLRNAGYDCSICKSKWKSSKEIPAGEHTYLEVVDTSNPKRGEMRIVIELAFRAEFEMARASEEYKRLIGRLPEVYVGKSERVKSLVKILCTAAKKCMKDKKMHLGPWRKHKYMQAKWLGANGKASDPVPAEYSSAGGSSDRTVAKARVSRLRFDRMENIVHRPAAVAVV